MADYQIRYWKEFPALVSARDKNGRAKVMLSERFQLAIDQAAMVDGSTSTDDYLDGWVMGPKQAREGGAEEVAQAVAGELEAEYPQERLLQMVRAHHAAKDGGAA